jgi:hypothetical protein
MSQFDIAASISRSALDKLLGDLFKTEAARQKLFAYSGKEAIGDFGEVKYTITVNQAPTMRLVFPDAGEWQKAVNPKKVPKPMDNAIQLIMEAFTFSLSIDNGASSTHTGKISLFGELVTTDAANPYLQVDAAYIETKFSRLDKYVVNKQIIPRVLEMANKLLKTVVIPAVPAVAGLEFRPVQLKVVDDGIIAATSLTSSPETIIHDMAVENGIFINVTNTIPNTLFKENVNGKKQSEADRVGPKDWYAAYKVSVVVNHAELIISPDNVVFTLHIGEPEGTAEVGGTGVGVTKTVLCPIATAFDAIADPDNWDKIIGSIGFTINPLPIAIPSTISITHATVKQGGEDVTVQQAHLTVNEVSSFHVLAQPKWADSVSGAIIAAATSMLTDLLPTVLQTLIVNKIAKTVFGDVCLYTIPPLTATTEGVTVTLKVVEGTVKTVAGMLKNELKMAIS